MCCKPSINLVTNPNSVSTQLTRANVLRHISFREIQSPLSCWKKGRQRTQIFIGFTDKAPIAYYPAPLEIQFPLLKSVSSIQSTLQALNLDVLGSKLVWGILRHHRSHYIVHYQRTKRDRLSVKLDDVCPYGGQTLPLQNWGTFNTIIALLLQVYNSWTKDSCL
jgi:hypothetical protein